MAARPPPRHEAALREQDIVSADDLRRLSAEDCRELGFSIGARGRRSSSYAAVVQFLLLLHGGLDGGMRRRVLPGERNRVCEWSGKRQKTAGGAPAPTLATPHCNYVRLHGYVPLLRCSSTVLEPARCGAAERGGTIDHQNSMLNAPPLQSIRTLSAAAGAGGLSERLRKLDRAINE